MLIFSALISLLVNFLEFFFRFMNKWDIKELLWVFLEYFSWANSFCFICGSPFLLSEVHKFRDNIWYCKKIKLIYLNGLLMEYVREVEKFTHKSMYIAWCVLFARTYGARVCFNLNKIVGYTIINKKGIS